VDFLEVDMKSTLRATVELVSTGEAVPVEEGLGTVTFVVRNVEIECLPDDLVAELPVDLTLIGTPDDVIRLSDIVLPEGITLLDDPETVVARFEYEAAEEEEELEEGELEAAAEDVEVIARGKQEEEDF
jgi:large subunit ribosomal protein L25